MNFTRLISASAAALFTVATADAIILFRTDDPQANTTAPTGSLADSGWQYEGQWGVNSGTPIAPHFFITAHHVGGSVGQIFNFRGIAYKTTASFSDPESDLLIWQVAETFPAFAPLFEKLDEVGRPLVVIGRGTQRGSAISYKRETRGWGWGATDSVQRWGQNVVSQIVSGGVNDDFLYATFDEQRGAANRSTNEAHLSAGDSGGGVFLNDGGTWKLAGVNYAVDGPFYTSAADTTGFNGALFDTRNFYSKDGATYVLITGKNAVPSGFYATRISTKVGWIRSVIGPTN
ncbi:MAG: hypothetical protein M3Z64_03735 [Verrucomicrobiota bacterium]|nr:hypothetical protein [Verrucomicrobiota bacterium]